MGKMRSQESPEVNISTFAGRGLPAKKKNSCAVIFKLGCFVQKYWSGTVTLKTLNDIYWKRVTQMNS